MRAKLYFKFNGRFSLRGKIEHEVKQIYLNIFPHGKPLHEVKQKRIKYIYLIIIIVLNTKFIEKKNNFNLLIDRLTNKIQINLNLLIYTNCLIFNKQLYFFNLYEKTFCNVYIITKYLYLRLIYSIILYIFWFINKNHIKYFIIIPIEFKKGKTYNKMKKIKIIGKPAIKINSPNIKEKIKKMLLQITKPTKIGIESIIKILWIYCNIIVESYLLQKSIICHIIVVKIGVIKIGYLILNIKFKGYYWHTITILGIKSRIMCFHCGTLGHFKDQCKKEQRCLKCSQMHSTSSCKKLTKKCINCRANHRTTSKNCRFTQTRKIMEREENITKLMRKWGLKQDTNNKSQLDDKIEKDIRKIYYREMRETSKIIKKKTKTNLSKLHNELYCFNYFIFIRNLKYLYMSTQSKINLLI